MSAFRTALETRESDFAMTFLNELYSGVDMDPHPEAFSLEVSAGGDDRFASLRERWTASGRFEMEPQPVVIVVEVIDGAWNSMIGRTQPDTSRPCLFPPLPATARWQESFSVNGTQLDIGSMDAYAADHFGVPGLHVHFSGNSPVTAERQRSWEAVSGFVRDDVVADDELLQNDLIRDHAYGLLVASLLRTFPNNTLDLALPHDGATALPAALRRAVAYMEEHIAESILVEDIALAARLSPRGLQNAFERLLGTTPMRYLRDLRLEAARTDLRAAQAGDTVAIIAHRWGFVHLPRFAHYYRDAFGENPGETLRG
ncbi:helix-turn-helix transcriptional regulator [Leifsonia sp. NPDC058194]|uniref:helix-turn-helix transcriptional regulator n=1 Tax=Leifsonia sp. NPDC058194 TaxID=3346374 RepID=UPI0036DD7701